VEVGIFVCLTNLLFGLSHMLCKQILIVMVNSDLITEVVPVRQFTFPGNSLDSSQAVLDNHKSGPIQNDSKRMTQVM
jgi:hypothetical protein